MILYGRYLSPFVRRTAISLLWLGFTYDHKDVSAIANSEAVSLVNPLCRVPVLELDDGTCLVESWAILDTLNDMVGETRSLVPAHGPDRRDVLQTVALATGAAEKGVAVHYERTRRPPDKIHDPWVRRCLTQILGGLAELEAHLSSHRQEGGEFFHGETLTQADISVVSAFDFLRIALPEDVSSSAFPKLSSLSASCASFPAFSRTLPPTP